MVGILLSWCIVSFLQQPRFNWELTFRPRAWVIRERRYKVKLNTTTVASDIVYGFGAVLDCSSGRSGPGSVTLGTGVLTNAVQVTAEDSSDGRHDVSAVI